MTPDEQKAFEKLRRRVDWLEKRLDALEGKGTPPSPSPRPWPQPEYPPVAVRADGMARVDVGNGQTKFVPADRLADEAPEIEPANDDE